MPTKHVPRSGLVAPGRNAAFLRGSVDLPRSQRSWPVEASRLQLTHSPERTAGTQVKRIPTAINQTEQRGENIWLKKYLLVGNQLKPEQCSECSGSQRQSKPLIFEGADHGALAAAPINRAFSQKPTPADPLSPSHLFSAGNKTPNPVSILAESIAITVLFKMRPVLEGSGRDADPCQRQLLGPSASAKYLSHLRSSFCGFQVPSTRSGRSVSQSF